MEVAVQEEKYPYNRTIDANFKGQDFKSIAKGMKKSYNLGKN